MKELDALRGRSNIRNALFYISQALHIITTEAVKNEDLGLEGIAEGLTSICEDIKDHLALTP